MIPIAKMEKFCNAPPPNVSSKPKTEACSVMKSIASLLEYGTGINVPRRKTTNMSNVNMIFRLISPTRIKLESARNIKSPQFYRLLLRLLLLRKQRTYELLQ